MDLSYGNAATRIDLGQPLPVQDALGRRLAVVSGAAWITQDGDRRDTIVESGQEFVFDRPGSALIQALGSPTRVVLEDRAAAEERRAPPGGRLRTRFGRWLKAMRTRALLHSLSDRTLADIGIRRAEIDCLVR